MITGEGVECANLMPSGAQLCCGAIPTEPANIGTYQCDSKHIHLHWSEDWYFHIVYLSVIVSEPDRAILAHASEVASGNNHCALLFGLEPLVWSFDLEGAKEGMWVELGRSILMLSIQVDCFKVQAFSSWCVWELVGNRITKLILIFVANSIAEVRRLIHVLPQSIELQCVLEPIKLRSPVRWSVRVKEVRIDGFIGPDFTSSKSLIRELQEDILLNTLVIGWVVLSGSLWDACINDRHEFHVILMKTIDELS